MPNEHVDEKGDYQDVEDRREAADARVAGDEDGKEDADGDERPAKLVLA